MDELGALILGERPKEKGSDIIAPNKSRNTGKNPQLQPEPDRPDELGNLILGSAPAPTQQALQKPSSFRGNVAEALTKAFQMKQAMPATAASGLDVLAGGISGLAQLPGYVAGRAFGLSDVEAERAASKVPQQLAQPIGRMTGMAQTPAYQQAFPTQAAEKFGQADAVKLKALLKPYCKSASDEQRGCAVKVEYHNQTSKVELMLGNDWRVDLHEELIAGLTQWLSRDNVKILYN